jgi:hypothetical protein
MESLLKLIKERDRKDMVYDISGGAPLLSMIELWKREKLSYYRFYIYVYRFYMSCLTMIPSQKCAE